MRGIKIPLEHRFSLRDAKPLRVATPTEGLELHDRGSLQWYQWIERNAE